MTSTKKRILSPHQQDICQKFQEDKMPKVVFPEHRPCRISGDHSRWIIKFNNNEGKEIVRELVCIGDGMNVYAFEHKERLFVVEFFA